MDGMTGFEPTISCSQGKRYTKLSYIPIYLQRLKSLFMHWSGVMDSLPSYDEKSILTEASYSTTLNSAAKPPIFEHQPTYSSLMIPSSIFVILILWQLRHHCAIPAYYEYFLVDFWRSSSIYFLNIISNYSVYIGSIQFNLKTHWDTLLRGAESLILNNVSALLSGYWYRLLML